MFFEAKWGDQEVAAVFFEAKWGDQEVAAVFFQANMHFRCESPE